MVNGRLFDETPFREFYFQPVAGNAGGPLGCALSWYYENYPQADKKASAGEDLMSTIKQVRSEISAPSSTGKTGGMK